jgi:two-component system, chemotaxis family, sensor kinase CheA
MDRSDYLPMFLAECRESLDALNLAVVKIEETPDDRETVDSIFRIAHSLKGMSATMGFARMAELTHAMEDVFELLRQRTDGLERAAIDVLLRCLDTLEAATDEIEKSGEERFDPAALIAQLHALVRPRTDDQETVRAGGAIDADELRALAAGRRVVHAHVELEEAVDMPAVRAYMIVHAAAAHGELLGAVPTEEAIDAFTGREVQVWVATDASEEILLAALADVSDVRSVVVAEVPEETPPEVRPEEVSADELPSAPVSRKATTVRVDAERLDQLMHLMGELVVARTHVESLASAAEVPGFQAAMQELTRTAQALQSMVMQVRMIPVEAVFLRFPRLVRDLSQKLGKQVELDLVGQDTELDRTVVDALGDPMVHLVRNALDHALEPPDERRAAGKPAAGKLQIAARHAGGSVVISVTDDGRGLDPAKIARKAAEKGLITPEAADAIDMQRAIELLFAPGFSTAEQTSDISGRGVGMDAVRTKIRELGGEVILQSETGAGTSAQIRLPLTLAIISALLVESRGLPFAIPLDRVERTLAVGDHPVRSVAGQKMLVLGDGVLPLAPLGAALGYGGGGPGRNVVIARGGEQRIAIEVERLVGQRELVTRPLPPEVGDRAALSGGAVLSNGEIALIVDCDALVLSAGAAELREAA